MALAGLMVPTAGLAKKLHKPRSTHIAIQEQLAGSVVRWLEKISDEQYGG